MLLLIVYTFSNVFLYMQELYHAGARKIGVLGFPPIGCIPGQITLFGGIGEQGCIEEMNAVALAHNKNLKVAIAQAQVAMPGVQLLYLDGYSFLYDVYHNPSKYGELIYPQRYLLIFMLMFFSPDSLMTFSTPWP